MYKLIIGAVLIVLLANGSLCSKQKKKKIEDSESKEIEDNARKLADNPELMEGDMLMPPGATSRNAIASDRNLWPDGRIPVEVDSSYPHSTQLIDQAMQHIEKQTCVRFIPKTNEQNYVHIFSGEGCYSHVGRIGGAQRLSLHAGCQNFGTVLHELLHAIGFYHAHNRSDRDKYLRIHWGSIQQAQRHNFRQLSSSENKLFFPNRFDFKSVMLYGPTAFSKDGRSITMSSFDRSIRFVPVRQKTRLSREDVLAINYLYKCQRKSPSRENNNIAANRNPSVPSGQYRPFPPLNQFYFPFYFG